MRFSKRYKILIIFFLLISSNAFVTHPSYAEGPNIILVTIDSLRPDHLGCYGYKRNTSPNIDKLAKEGVLFMQAISQAPWSYPSIFSIFSGTYPHIHGMISPAHKLKDVSLLSQILKQNNYYTMAVCAHYTISGIERLRQTFDKFLSFKGAADNFWISNNAQVVTAAAINYLRSNYKRKFFLWLHYMDCHGPYKPPPPYYKMWDGESTEDINGMPISEHMWLGLGGVPQYMAKVMDVKHMSREKYISLYDGEISFVDSQIGILLDEVKKSGIEKNTLIILTSDHGESLGEHNYFGHELLLYDVLLKVPLIIKFPQVFPYHKIINKQARSIDIMPTILDVLNIAGPEAMEGKSLTPLIWEESNIETSYAYSSYENYLKRYAIRTEGWKLIYTLEDDHYELYNLKQDPGELVNLYEKENKNAMMLKTELEKYLYLSCDKEAEGIDAETKRILRSLGYLQ